MRWEGARARVARSDVVVRKRRRASAFWRDRLETTAPHCLHREDGVLGSSIQRDGFSADGRLHESSSSVGFRAEFLPRRLAKFRTGNLPEALPENRTSVDAELNVREQRSVVFSGPELDAGGFFEPRVTLVVAIHHARMYDRSSWRMRGLFGPPFPPSHKIGLGYRRDIGERGAEMKQK
ncbi:hypothetical protein BDY21DRAFT_71556 [Lineolata rhizophorae]|uniref:Uncharacterized protein n=1 Tax=Lineolata rhizophorae TaxID=578093 RepID=A0A6A6NTX8_9PEZI|nr:hypothetical protein BDY21DRAFT_71556 [Lineolata rhizophorae]